MGSLADWYPLRRVGERTYCINYNAESERCGDYAVLERHRSTKSPYRVSLYEKVYTYWTFAPWQFQSTVHPVCLGKKTPTTVSLMLV